MFQLVCNRRLIADDFCNNIEKSQTHSRFNSYFASQESRCYKSSYCAEGQINIIQSQ